MRYLPARWSAWPRRSFHRATFRLASLWMVSIARTPRNRSPFMEERQLLSTPREALSLAAHIFSFMGQDLQAGLTIAVVMATILLHTTVRFMRTNRQ